MIVKTKIIDAIIISIVMVALVAPISFSSPVQSKPVVGAFFYLWYGIGSQGWNDTNNPGGGVVVDKPFLGYYVSDSNATFQCQISEMQETGISLAIVSWWSPGNQSAQVNNTIARSINKATLDLFKYLNITNSNFKVAIMVDAYNGSSNLSNSSFAEDYNYVFSNFVEPFKQFYFVYEGYPLLLFFNPLYPAYNDTRFTVRTIGNRPNNVNWIWWEAPPHYFVSQNSPANATNDEGQPVISSDGEVNIVPRIDSYFNRANQINSSFLRFDYNFSLGLYQEQWEFVIQHRDQAKLVLIYSWNEYIERSEIEPHSDWTNQSVGLFYLTNLTLHYINEINETSPINLGLAASFLEELYNPSIGLCRETLVKGNETIHASNGSTYECDTNETYWIASDNYLDSLALSSYNATLSEIINQTCNKYYNGSYFPYQIMQGKLIPSTLHIANTYVLKNTSDYIIALNLYNGIPHVNDNTTLDQWEYGDTLVYEAINYYVQGYSLNWCDNLYMKAYGMFDGKGVADAAFYNSSKTASSRVYSNMKLALLIFGAKVLNLIVDLTGIEQQLWSAQNYTEPQMGGIMSLMNSSGQPVGSANGETTALTLLAYDDNLIKQIQLERPKPSISVMFPARTFNQTISITTGVTAIPLLNPWTVSVNNTVLWASSQNNPRVGLGFYSSLDYKANLSIQLIEYNSGVLDINIHNETYPNGMTITSIHWSNPLTISLGSDILNVSSRAGAYSTSFPSFSLAYITAGSTPLIPNTNISGICSGGQLDIQINQVPEFPSSGFLALFLIATFLIVAVYRRKRHRLCMARVSKSAKE
jgi:hypothetical protein